MSEFDTALSYVHEVLRTLQSGGSTHTAPVPALARLAALAGSPGARPTRPPAPVSAEPRPRAAAPLLSPPPAETGASTAPPSGRPRPTVPILPKLPPLSVAPPAGSGTKAERLAALRQAAEKAASTEDLVRFAHPHLAFGKGHPEADVLFISEAPGEDESLQQDPLETEAGAILLRMIKAMEMPASRVYVAHVLRVRMEKRARASEHRQPTAAERTVALQQLQEQIAILQPRVLVALGAAAVEGLLGVTESIGKVRSQWLDYRGVPLLATYSPAYLARNQALVKKREVWSDMLLVLEKLGCPISEKQQGYFLSKRSEEGPPA